MDPCCYEMADLPFHNNMDPFQPAPPKKQEYIKL
jgi:hypothetical protein